MATSFSSLLDGMLAGILQASANTIAQAITSGDVQSAAKLIASVESQQEALTAATALATAYGQCTATLLEAPVGVDNVNIKLPYNALKSVVAAMNVWYPFAYTEGVW